MQDDPTSKDTRRIFPRIVKTSGICMVIAASLLCFPHWLPWMIAFWLAWYTFAVVQGRPGHWPLLGCGIILVLRLVPPLPWLLLMVAALIAVGLFLKNSSKRKRRFQSVGERNLMIATTAGLWIIWMGMFWQYREASHVSQQIKWDPDRPIICIGDSLTEGMIPDRGYPGQLEDLVKIPVINKGASGISTGPAIGILQRALKQNPQVVVLELGGHDFLKWHSRSSTKANLVQMIQMCQANDCEVILMEIPRGFMFDPYFGLERELSYQFDLQLVDDRWLRHIVLMGPAAPPGMWIKSHQLSDDGIHSNPQGSRVIAQRVADSLANLYGETVLK